MNITIAEAAKQIAAKALSPVELTQQCLAQVEALNSTLHAFILVTADRAMADAKAAEAAIMANGPKTKLHGIPLGLKDIIDTKGIPTTCHSAQLLDNVPTADATCAVKLAEAGSVLMGKLSTHEFADGGPSFDLPFPPARNPWDPAHFTAGSSSGTGRRGAGGHDPGRPRHRYRRVDPWPGGVVRHRGDQADLRPGQPLRRGAGGL